MTLPIDPSAELGPSEFSHGPGLFPNQQSNFQAGKTPFPEIEPGYDNYRKLVMERRVDSTVADESEEDLMVALGNPDRFGGQPPLVRTLPNVPLAKEPDPELKQRVEREG